LCHSDSLVNDDDHGGGDDDDDDDTTLVKQSEAAADAAAAASDAEQHLESQVAHLQRCAVLCDISKIPSLIYTAGQKLNHFLQCVRIARNAEHCTS